MDVMSVDYETKGYPTMNVISCARPIAGLLFAAAVALGSAGCKKDPPAASTTAAGSTAPGTAAAAAPAGHSAHCDTVQLSSTCREYRPIAVEAAGEDSLRTLCGIGPGTFAAGPCATADLVGTCDLPEHIERYYSRGPSAFTAQTAQAACAGGLTAGTFRAGP